LHLQHHSRQQYTIIFYKNQDREKNMDTKKTLYWITRTAILIALLIALQWGTAAVSGGNQFITGSAVNLVLIVSAVLSGLTSGIAVALLSPFFATFIGIASMNLVFVPFVAVGNVVLVIAWYIIAGKISVNTEGFVRMMIALVVGALLKFAVLYLLFNKILPGFLNVPEKMMGMFSVPQLITALIGGAIAILIIPLLKRAIKTK